jgi:nucleotide-binding universal stress UspA family protein
MERPKKTVLIPWDFTDKAEYAFAHAVNVSKITGHSISLLNVVKRESEIQQATTNLLAAADAMTQKYGVKPEIIIKKGDIFKTIGQTATDHNADIVIMGTHGIRGLQKLTGSWALKVIVRTKVPFVVVQDFPKSNNYQKVVFPVDYKRESKEKIKWSSFLSGNYNSKFYIIHPKITDRGLKKKLHTNLFFTKKYLDNNRIEYEIIQAPGKSDFGKETIEYAQQVNADLILIITTKNIIFVDYVLGANEQQIIANTAKIPVMCVNPKPGKFAGGFSATGG